MPLWQSDQELFDLARRELFTAVVGDILDRFGYLHQFLPAEVQPLRDDMIVLGRAMPVLEADVFGDASHAMPDGIAKPFGLMLYALDDLKPGEVYVCTGGSPRYALWGELMSTRAIHLGAAGAVVNGYARDTRGILSLNFPTFSRGRYAQDQAPRGKVIDFRTTVEIGGVTVHPGDLVFGDIDGVLVVPAAVVDDVFHAALEKVRGEHQVRKAIEQGMSAVDAFQHFGIM